ncbi:MAG: immunoglobulin domain-containing protein [Verrucomicrobia subdivision 3 bacterium]|nr:immunoglobulin domain-containing protein [Limisphaerales bacterium]
MKPQNIEILPLALALATLALNLSAIQQANGAGFVSVSPMKTARNFHTATLLPNGKVLVAGGFSTGTSAELYDPATDTWTVTGSLRAARVYHQATLLPNGKVLIAGSLQNGGAGQPSTSAELYDPATGTWTLTGPMKQARIFSTATLLPNGKVLVAGGGTGAELYDPASGTWTATGSPTSGGRATLLLNGKVLAGSELYDPATGTWTATGAPSGFGYYTATLLLTGKVLVAGGVRIVTAGLYDPDSGTWSATGSLTWDRDYCTATLLPNGQVLVAAGLRQGPDVPLASAEIYDPDSGTWTEIPMSSARFVHTATLLANGNVLVAGGNGVGFGLLSSAEIYQPDSVGSEPPWINIQPQSQIARIGQPATLLVIASGSPPLSYQWQKEETDIPGATAAAYSVASMQSNHLGSYAVIISNDYGAVTSQVATLDVAIPLQIRQAPLSQTVAPGATATFSVEVSGHPPPFNYEWRRLTPPTFTNRFDSTEPISFFAITNVQSGTTGRYAVTIRNPASPTGVPSVFTVSMVEDTDSDGMPDAWESTNQLNAAVNDADLDADGDDSSNRDEYIAGTDARDAQSYLKVERIANTGSATLWFQAVSNRTYTVHFTDALSVGVWTKLADVIARATNHLESVMDSAATTNRYYRLVTPRQP